MNRSIKNHWLHHFVSFGSQLHDPTENYRSTKHVDNWCFVVGIQIITLRKTIPETFVTITSFGYCFTESIYLYPDDKTPAIHMFCKFQRDRLDRIRKKWEYVCM